MLRTWVIACTLLLSSHASAQAASEKKCPLLAQVKLTADGLFFGTKRVFSIEDHCGLSVGSRCTVTYFDGVGDTLRGEAVDCVAVSSSGGGGFARQSEMGTQVAPSFAPNMFGD